MVVVDFRHARPYWYLVALALFAFLWPRSRRGRRLLRRTFLCRLLFPLRELRARCPTAHTSDPARPTYPGAPFTLPASLDPTVRHNSLRPQRGGAGADVCRACRGRLGHTAEVRVPANGRTNRQASWALHQLALEKSGAPLGVLFVLRVRPPRVVIALGAFVLFQALASLFRLHNHLSQPLTQ